MPELDFLPKFHGDYKRLTAQQKEVCKKALDFLAANPHHPSLRVKKMQGYKDIWEARIGAADRITFHMDGDVCILRRVGPHSILRHP